MTELGSPSSALPPPPPPPPPRAPGGFDFAKPFTFVFEDPGWLGKVLVGGLFYLAAVFLVGIFFLMGYCARLFRNVVEGNPRPLPEWNDLGEYFGEGVVLFGVGLVYALPIFVLVGFAVVPAVVAGIAGGGRDISALTSGIGGCMYCLILPLELALGFWLPGALTFAIVERRFGAAFEFSRIWNYIKANLGNYAMAFVIYLISSFAAQLGMILLCIGIIFTAFLALVIGMYGYAQVYRESLVR
jgi:hypothetical protein